MPREGSRTVREGIVVAEAMDWCRSPTAIVPYRIYTHHQVEGASTADSVRQTDERSHVRGSLIRQCYGDEPGVGGGVRSGTRGAECEPKTWSSSVRAEGRPMVRHDDEWWMNHRNTYGRLTYVKDAKRYETPEEKQVEPRIQWAFYQPPNTAPDISPLSAPSTVPEPTQPPQPEPQEIPTPGRDSVARRAVMGVVGAAGAVTSAVAAGILLATTTPLNKDENVRISRKRCRPRQVVFDLNGYSRPEYQRQLDLQQDKLNAKGPCKSRDDIDSFTKKTPFQKELDRKDAENAQRRFRRQWKRQNPLANTSDLAALHRLDMVAGGYKLDIADMGDSNINSSIGSQWNVHETGSPTSRQQEVREHADEMCRGQCPLGISLIVQ
nr:PAAR-like domain-containing protein [Methylobacterium ajmalii]